MSARETPRPFCTGSRNTANVSGTPRAMRFMAKVSTTSVDRNARPTPGSALLASSAMPWAMRPLPALARAAPSDAAELGHGRGEAQAPGELGGGRGVVPGIALGELGHRGGVLG